MKISVENGIESMLSFFNVGKAHISSSVAASLTVATLSAAAAYTAPAIGSSFSADTGASTLSAAASNLVGPEQIFGVAPVLDLDSRFGVLEADASAAEDGDNVQTWQTQGSGAWSNVTQATSANQFVYRATGGPLSLPALEADPTATTRFMTGTITGTASGDSYFVSVVHLPDLPNSRCPIEACDSSTLSNRGITFFYTSDSVVTFRWGNSGGSNNSTGDPLNTGGSNWRNTTLEGTTTSRTIYEANTALTGGTNPETTSRAIPALTDFKIGALIASSLFAYDGKLARIVVVRNVTITSTMRTNWAAYTNALYGV